MGKEGLPVPGVTGRRPGPSPKRACIGGRLPVCSLYPGLAERNRKRCCEWDPVSWAHLTWRGLRDKSPEGLAVVRCPWAAGLTEAWEPLIIFELEGGQYDIESEREARNRHVIQEATKRDLFWASGGGKEGCQLMVLYHKTTQQRRLHRLYSHSQWTPMKHLIHLQK